MLRAYITWNVLQIMDQQNNLREKKTEAFSLTTSFALYDRLAEKDPFSLIN
jgi:hypothetical protein